MSREITFFTRFEQDILAGRKTITIRDASESHFQPGEVLRVSRNEDGVFFCMIEVLSVTPVRLDALTEQHAQQENMSLSELASRRTSAGSARFSARAWRSCCA